MPTYAEAIERQKHIHEDGPIPYAFDIRTSFAKNGKPQRASRPFDADRDGFVLGEGAGVLVLESIENAEDRGVDPVAELVGYGSTADAYHVTQPAPAGEGGTRAMKIALDEAQLLKLGWRVAAVSQESGRLRRRAIRVATPPLKVLLQPLGQFHRHTRDRRYLLHRRLPDTLDRPESPE